MTIQEFSFGNYRSFKDLQTLNLNPAKIVSKEKSIDDNNIFRIDDESFLKSKIIYGANASGKSNVIKAVFTFINIVKSSVKDDKALLKIDPFRFSTITESEPTFFQMIFWHEGKKYRYGFEATDKSIYAEWLYSTPKKREIPFYIREGQKIEEIDKTNFSEGFKFVNLLTDDSGDNEIFRKNSLFISALASFGFAKLSKSLVEAISSIIVISGLGNSRLMDEVVNRAVLNDEKKKYMLNFLKYGDVGIDDLNSIEISTENLPDNVDEEFRKLIEQQQGRKVIITSRKKFDENNKEIESETLPFEMIESEGTKKLLELGPFIFDSIKQSRPLLIDEFDARFHPLLTKKIVELFNSSSNPNSQLIATTHDTNLLSSDLLRRDQIEFVEKDKFGASHLYSLVEFKGVRNDSSFEKDYILGKYGAIPFLGNFKRLLNDA